MKTIPIDGELREQVARALRETPLFSTLTTEQLDRVLGLATLNELAPTEYLTRENEPSDSFFVLMSGQATVMVEGQGGELVELGRMRPPESLGEVGLLLGESRTATVVARDTVLALRFDANTFRKMFDVIPDFGWAVCAGLAYRLKLLSYTVPLMRYEPTEDPSAETLEALPVDFLMRHRVLPLRLDGNTLTLGFIDDPSLDVIIAVKRRVPDLELQPVRISVADFDRLIDLPPERQGKGAGTGR